jgi:acyl-CoA synthetase (AMP-forming)/AMP-acid ligase II
MAWNLADIVRAQAATRPGAEALVCGERRQTWAELHRRSSRVAHVLIGAGVGPGDRVAVLARNNAEFFEVAFGAAKAGAITVSLNWRLTGVELAEILADAEPAVLVLDAEFDGLVTGGPARLRYGPDYETRVGAARDEDPDVPVAEDAVAYLLYTSGTTGRAKGVQLTHANLRLSENMARDGFGMDASSVHLCPGPQFHIAGAGTGLMAMFTGGRTVVTRDAAPEALLRTIERERVTHAFMVPAVIQSVLGSPELAGTDLSSLAQVSYGAAPMTESMLRRAMRDLGCGFLGVYGMTETAGTAVALPPADHHPEGPGAALLRSVGKALPWLELRVGDPVTGLPCDTGEVGEILVRGGQIMSGYWRRPDLTGQAVDAAGWLHTGDGGYLDPDGYLFLKDRIKDMIISGGENIYPAEVENALAHHPEILDSCVIGVPHERWGETVRAVVVGRPGSALDMDDVLSFARERLAGYKCPTSIVFAESLPRTPSGKIVKPLVRQRFGAG